MSDNKKYYYLKLKDNFFDSDSLIVLESMPDGYLYSNILLKLYLRSLKNEGKLMFNDRIPYNPTILAQITRHNVGVMEKALSLFKEMDLIEILDNGSIYMLDIQEFIGESSTEADRKRRYRMQIKQEKEGNEVLAIGQMSDECPDKYPPEIEIEIEIDKEIEIDIEEDKDKEIKIKTPSAPYEEIKDLFNDICKSYSLIRTVSNKRKGHLKARWNQYKNDIEVFKELFTLAEESNFLKGENDRNWKADFDWIINDNNMAKVLEGRYKNKGSGTDGPGRGNSGGTTKEVDRLKELAIKEGLIGADGSVEEIGEIDY